MKDAFIHEESLNKPISCRLYRSWSTSVFFTCCSAARSLKIYLTEKGIHFWENSTGRVLCPTRSSSGNPVQPHYDRSWANQEIPRARMTSIFQGQPSKRVFSKQNKNLLGFSVYLFCQTVCWVEAAPLLLTTPISNSWAIKWRKYPLQFRVAPYFCQRTYPLTNKKSSTSDNRTCFFFFDDPALDDSPLKINGQNPSL